MKVGTFTAAVSGSGAGASVSWSAVSTQVFFAAKLVKNSAGSTQEDIRGSVGSYYPYGEDRGSLPNDAVKFATYTRDSVSGLDYASNRFYGSTAGRLTSPDPYQASGAPVVPGSWNRYSYVQGDPINSLDRLGLDGQPVNPCGTVYMFSPITYSASSTTGSGPSGGNMFNCFVGYVMGWNAFSTAPTGNSGVNRSGFGQFSEPDIAYGWWSAGAPFVVTPVKTFDPLNPNSSFGLANPSLLQSLTPSYYGGTSTNGDAYGQSGPKISCPTGQHPLPSIGSTFPLFTCVPNSTPNTTLTTVVSSTGTLTNTLATGFGTSSIGGTHPTGNTLLPTTPPGGVQIIVPCYLSFPGLPCSP